MCLEHQPTRRPFWLPLQAPNDIKGAILCFPAEAYVLTGNGMGAGNHTHTHIHVCGSMYKWDCMHVCSQAGSRVSADTLTPVPQYLQPSLCSIGITTLKLDLCFAMSYTPDSHLILRHRRKHLLRFLLQHSFIVSRPLSRHKPNQVSDAEGRRPRDPEPR